METASEREAVAQTERDGAEIRLARQTMLKRGVLKARFKENATWADVELTAQKTLEAELRITLAVLQAKRCGRRALQEHLRLHAHIRVKAFFRKQPVRNRQTNRHRFFDKIPLVRPAVRRDACGCRGRTCDRARACCRVTLVSATKRKREETGTHVDASTHIEEGVWPDRQRAG